MPGVDPTSLSYDGRGRPKTAVQGARAASITYDAFGNVASTTDSLGRTQSFSYDAVGRVQTQTLPDQRVISYGYDANGNLTQVTPPQRPAHGFAYDATDRQTGYTAPDLGSGTETTITSYDQDHNPSFVDRPGSQDVDIDYDSAGRLSTVSEPVGTTTLGYDPQTGQLASVDAPGGQQLSLEHDGALPTAETFSGPVSGSASRTYDDDFEITSTSVNGANTVNHSYDNDGLLTSAGSLTLSRNAQNGLLAGTSQDALQTSLTRNAFGEVASMQASHSSTALLPQIFARDNGGRIAQETETTDLGSHTYAYTYDDAGRLSEVAIDGQQATTYTYDPNGNRTQTTRQGQGTTFATYDDQDRPLTYGPNSYSYTPAGDLAQKHDSSTNQTTSYDYDAQGGLRAVGLPDGDQITYLLDGFGRRVQRKKNANTTHAFIYASEAQGPIAELDSTGNLRSRFVYATRQNVPDYMTKNGRSYRIVTDDLGSPRVVIDTQNATIAQRLDYDAFGNTTRDTNPGFQPFGYAGGLYDPDTKLVRFGARDYDPETGRWTSKDPIGFSGGDANLYGYVVGDPAKTPLRSSTRAGGEISRDACGRARSLTDI